MAKTEMDKRIEATIQESEQKNNASGETPGTDVYGKVQEREADTGVEIPTKDAVEEAKEWVEENQM